MTPREFTPPSPKTHFLVSGGGKGITAANAIALARKYQSEFTLIGRSPLFNEEPDWAHGIDSEPDLKQNLLNHAQANGEKMTPKQLDRLVQEVLSSREILATLHEIKQAGSEVSYLQVDITNQAELKEKINHLSSEINGILHGAGALADKYIEDKQDSDFELVYGVKVAGLQNILKIIPVEKLEYLILFSSVAGYYGNAGQADYSLGNEVLNKFAHHLNTQYPDCQVLVIDWGPWDGGMVTPQLKRILTRKNVQLIPIDGGTKTMVELLSQSLASPQWVVGNPLPRPAVKLSQELQQYRIRRRLSYSSNPFLADHVIGGKPVLPTVCAVSWFVNSCEDLYPGFKFHAVRKYQVFKGIVFNDKTEDEYLLELNEIEKSQDIVVFQGKISSQPSGEKVRYHYQAQIEMRKTLPPRPLFNDFQLVGEVSLTGKELYQSKTLFHGPSFQGVVEILNLNSDGLTVKCNLPSISNEMMGQYPVRSFNPYLADVHLQSILIWAASQLESTGLPLKIASGIQFHMPPFNSDTYATLQVDKKTKHKLVANVISHDREGSVLTEVTGAEITLNDSLFELFQHNQVEKEILWQ